MRCPKVRYIVLFVALLLLFCSCGGGTAPGKDSDHGDTDDEAPVQIEQGSSGKYVIIIAANATEAEREASLKLQGAFRKYLNADLNVKIDLLLESAGYVESEYEIVVGKTNRDFSQVFSFDQNRAGVYCMAKQHTKLLLAGAKDAGTVQAVDLFIQQYLSSATGKLIFRDSDSRVVEPSYLLEEFSVNGSELGHFNLIYRGISPVFSADTVSFAEALETSYGYFASVGQTKYPSTFYVGTVSELPQYAALLGNDPAVLAAVNGQPALVGRDESAVVTAMRELAQIISREENRIIMQDNSVAMHFQEREALTSMSFNLAGGLDFDKRKEAVLYTIKQIMPDTLGIQEGKTQWIEFLSRLESYASVGEGNKEAGYTETYNQIYYRTDRFRLIDGGTIWLSDQIHGQGSKFPESKRVRTATYALLEVKATGDRILYVNTHLDNASADAREKQIKVLMDFVGTFDAPCVMTGDFNSNPSTKVYSFVTSGYMEDARIEAEHRDSVPTFNGFGKGSSTLDYLFFTKGKFHITYYRVNDALYQDQVYPSDHNSIYAVYTLIKK